MRRTLGIAAILLLAAAPASSSIVYVDLPPPEGFFGGAFGRPATKSFDIDGNGTIDIEFVAGLEILGFYVKAPPSTRVVVVSGYGVLPMQPGEVIGPELGPTSHPRACLFPDPPLWTALTGLATLSFGFNDNGDVTGGPWHPEGAGIGDDGYLGFEFTAEDGVHYGWIHILEFAGIGGWFYEYAYEGRPGAPILAAAKPLVVPTAAPEVVRARYLRLKWSSELGKAYQVQTKTRLDALTWTNLSFVIPATATETIVDLPMEGPAQFFRVIEAD